MGVIFDIWKVFWWVVFVKVFLVRFLYELLIGCFMYFCLDSLMGV